MLFLMTRRHFVSLPAVSALAKGTQQQPGFPGTHYRDYSRCLPDYLRFLARQAYQRRNREIAKLISAPSIRARRHWVRETFLKLIGGLPERTPLNARTVGSFERKGYKVEKLVYESQPNFHIPANLYIPKSGRAPYPGVLFQMGHARNGKAYEPYQRCCQGLAQLGFLVLAFDPIGQGERIYYPDSSGLATRLASSDDEHTLPGKQMLLLGETCTRLQLWDAIRSLDYLSSHPLVDPKRLASTGHSGGGTLTMLLATVDDRLTAASVCMGNTENVACANFRPPGSTDDAEQDFIGSGPLGFDRWDLLYPIAPKPLQISVSDRDFFATYSPEYIANGWEEFGKLRRVYEVLGRSDQLAWADTPLPHDLLHDSRMQIYKWLVRWLQPDAGPVNKEPPVKPEADPTLWAAESGNTVRSFHGASPFTLNRSRSVAQNKSSLEVLLGVTRPGALTRAKTIGRVALPKLEVQAFEVPSEPGVWISSWLLLPEDRDSSKPVLLALDPSGKDRSWFEREIDQAVPAHSPIVCAADLRGIGELAPEFSPGAPSYMRTHEQGEDYAWGSLILGKPLVGQQVTDILALVSALRAHPALAGRRLRLAAFGRLTVPAIFAAALDSRIQELYLAGGLVSFRSIVDTEEPSHSFANFVPNLLRHTDLPELVAALAPRPVYLAGTVDAAGQTLAVDDVRRIYAAADTAGNLKVGSKAEWTVERIIAGHS